MKSARPNQRGISTRFTAVLVAVMIVISSAAMAEVLVNTSPKNETELGLVDQSYQSRPCVVSSVLAQGENWTSFDSSAPGTPAQVHVTTSDTSGITIVADFFGFWRGKYTINSTVYDNLEMPGASVTQDPGAPMLPCLFEYVEIPHDIDVSIDVIASSSASISEYNVRPAPFPNVPVGQYEYNTTPPSTVVPDFLDDDIFSNDAFFPGSTTGTEGGMHSESLVMRGHRLLGVSFYPVQYNPVMRELTVYSQIVIKVRYSVPAQIQPAPYPLRSAAFEQILMNIVLNHDSCGIRYTPEVGTATEYGPRRPDLEAAEYLIITTEEFKSQALRLAEWKERKGVPSAVKIVQVGDRNNVTAAIEDAYKNWDLAPTYGLLLGDVEDIPANYDVQHEGKVGMFKPFFEKGYGYIASDLGYFCIDGSDYVPDMVYGRISVDTAEQARVIVDKILRYEQSPPDDQLFYSSILSAGYFEDKNTRDGVEDSAFPFIYTLERIRHYLEDSHEYSVHINYTRALAQTPESFHAPLDPSDPDSILVENSLPAGYVWLLSNWYPPYHLANARNNISLNINEGRFLVLCYSHGGSKNMVYPIQLGDGRDLEEGWHQPLYNTSYLSDLSNGDETPLFVNIACDTGWFDGETDQYFMAADPETSPFNECKNECFAENITRLEGGGAVAAVSPSRIGYSKISGHLLDGIIQAFWPGFLGSASQPIYEMGAALLFAKLYSSTQWRGTDVISKLFEGLQYPQHAVRTTFEEYHLFGDPETQLWTGVPSEFDVTYPASIGTSSPQRFAVTVRNTDTGEPVHLARVCIQQGPYVYQVGSTDPAGQVVFDITPADTPSSLNMTVTKHNYVPKTGAIQVVSSNAVVTVYPEKGSSQQAVHIWVFGFDEAFPVNVYFDDALVANIPEASGGIQAYFPDGPNGYANIRAVQRGLFPLRVLVATTRFYRLSTAGSPDPYIYSQSDSETWYLTGGRMVWDNPCITIYQGSQTVNQVSPGMEYDVKVKVFNRGNVVAADTSVTLSWSRLGGAVSWPEIGTTQVTIDPSGVGEVAFTWTPYLSGSMCLRVDLYHGAEDPDDMTDNVGEECLDVVPLCSQGGGELRVENPTNTTEYVFVKVRQEGDYDDTWNASIVGYSSQAMSAGAYKDVTFLVDPSREIASNESRAFTIEVHIHCKLVGGKQFTATQGICTRTCCLPCLLILGVTLIAAGIVCYRRRTRKLTRRDLVGITVVVAATVLIPLTVLES